jgi:hypothetical protein
VRVERDSSYTFARVLARPIAGVERGRYALVLSPGARLPDYPEDETTRKGTRSRRGRKATVNGG